MTSRGIDYLSAGLYSEQSHFVLELIQNADDNQYAAGVEPTLRVTVHQDGVSFENNELGFTRANVLALCNVGDSTKHGMKGLIGHKGIGFKSVFSVSPRPEIHSRCYHFMFDLTATDGLGHADWDVTASREAIDESSLWNKWLREQLPQAFAKSVRAFSERIQRAMNSDTKPKSEEAESDEESQAEAVTLPAGKCAYALAMLLIECFPACSNTHDFFTPTVPLMVREASKALDDSVRWLCEGYLNQMGLSFVHSSVKM
eukprot:m51a1_g8079 hypothetical protein (258) ;mRNA; f:211198-212526